MRWSVNWFNFILQGSIFELYALTLYFFPNKLANLRRCDHRERFGLNEFGPSKLPHHNHHQFSRWIRQFYAAGKICNFRCPIYGNYKNDDNDYHGQSVGFHLQSGVRSFLSLIDQPPHHQSYHELYFILFLLCISFYRTKYLRIFFWDLSFMRWNPRHWKKGEVLRPRNQNLCYSS